MQQHVLALSRVKRHAVKRRERLHRKLHPFGLLLGSIQIYLRDLVPRNTAGIFQV